MARGKQDEREEPIKETGWDATTVLILVGMIAFAIAVGVLFN